MEAILTVDRQSLPSALVHQQTRSGTSPLRLPLNGAEHLGPAKVCMQGRDRRLRFIDS